MYKRLILAILLLLGVSPLWGQPDAEQTGQGYSDDSAWARGQSWGLYGYTMMYRETLDPGFIDLIARGLRNAVDPASSDYLLFDGGVSGQPLVDAAFLAEGILRAPTMIWGRLDGKTKERLVTEWKRSREIRPGESNWLLFASMVEAALLGLSLQGMDGEESVERGGCRCRPSSVKGVSF